MGCHIVASHTGRVAHRGSPKFARCACTSSSSVLWLAMLWTATMSLVESLSEPLNLAANFIVRLICEIHRERLIFERLIRETHP